MEKKDAFKCDSREKQDFCEQNGCVCCGNGFLHIGTAKWFYLMADMIDYLNSAGELLKESEEKNSGNKLQDDSQK